MANTEAVAVFAFAESGASELYCVIPMAAKFRAKMTYMIYKTMYSVLAGNPKDMGPLTTILQ